ncbi:hypothetical protein ACFL1H_06060 [Nanoarchaeota archaeon]
MKTEINTIVKSLDDQLEMVNNNKKLLNNQLQQYKKKYCPLTHEGSDYIEKVCKSEDVLNYLKLLTKIEITFKYKYTANYDLKIYEHKGYAPFFIRAYFNGHCDYYAHTEIIQGNKKYYLYKGTCNETPEGFNLFHSEVHGGFESSALIGQHIHAIGGIKEFEKIVDKTIKKEIKTKLKKLEKRISVLNATLLKNPFSFEYHELH